jgi:DNA-binding beta-propeller fold protein YncE
MQKWSGLAVAAILGSVAAAACGGGNGGGQAKGPAAPVTPVAAPARSAACHKLATASVTAVSAAGTSSTLVLVNASGRTLAYVSDEDVHAVLTVDVDAKKQLASTPVDGIPGHMILSPDGRLLVSVKDKNQVLAFEPPAAPDKPLITSCFIDTAVEPVGLALAPDGTVLVTSGWGRALAGYDGDTLAKKYEVALGREPRAVVVSDDGKSAFVSHAVGSQMSVVELASGKVKTQKLRGKDPLVAMRRRVARAQPARLKAAGVKVTPEMERRFAEMEKETEADQERGTRSSCQGYALAKSIDPGGRVLAPEVFVDNGDPNMRAEGYGDDDTPTEAASVAVLDDTTGAPIDTSLALSRERMFMGNGDDPRDHHQPCLLPRAAVVDPATKNLLVTCFGIDDVIAYDSAAASPVRAEKRRWGVGAGPTGIALDGPKHRAIVWSQFDRVVDVIELTNVAITNEKTNPREHSGRVELPAAPRKIASEVALGRLLFHAAGDNRIAKDGRACASCHPDGRDDAITWATPDGPRRTILLAGRVSQTPPYSWSNGEKTLREHLATTFDRLDGGGLRSAELDAIVAYISTLAPPNGSVASRPKDAKVTRGEQVFLSKEAKCADCHIPGADYSDGQLHDVKSKAKADRGDTFNTPSLRGVGGTGPWFHDGRYKTLKDLLKDVDGKMGNTKQLSETDLDALEAYLRSI